MVYYRKYRPQTIDDLDSLHVREVLTSVLSKENTPHAFLFTGPKGLGKTSTARIVAKVINCERIENRKIAYSSKDKKLNAKRYTLDAGIEPCNACNQCTSTTSGTNLDVFEIDAASNRGIDEIRDLREKIKLSPAAAKKKVYIIDEVHMLTTEAFNALLKTLEEPPLHAVFILCTTEMHKVPGTILSRCFHIGFTLATEDELVRAFERIVKGEKIAIDKEALSSIAKLSDGSFRDGTKVLEEIVALSNGKKITKEIVDEKYNISSIEQYISGLLDVFAEKDRQKGLRLIAEIVVKGIDVRYVMQQLFTTLHSMLLEEVGMGEKKSTESYTLSIEEIVSLVNLLSTAYSETKFAVLPQLPLELVIIEWSGRQVEKTMPEGEGVTVDDLRKTRKNIEIRTVIEAHRSGPLKKTPNENEDETPKETQRQTSIEKRVGTHQDFYDELLDEVKLKNHSIAGVLRGSIIKSFTDGKLVLQTAYKFHKERLDDGKTKILIEKAAKDITGKNIEVRIELKNRE